MYTQRKKERRSYNGRLLYPLVEKGGYLVEKDRRSIPDRRLGNIHLELVDIVDRNYANYLSSTSLNHQSKKTV